tara:strand:+ start:409 stop:636 length:228 start_codon:yes stop_codon:yes gene_type:complete
VGYCDCDGDNFSGLGINGEKIMNKFKVIFKTSHGKASFKVRADNIDSARLLALGLFGQTRAGAEDLKSLTVELRK